MLYINVCAWRRVPAPQEDLTKPMPLHGGKLQSVTEGDKDCYTVLDVAVNPAALELGKTNRAMEKLYLLILSFAQKQYGLTLSQQYTVTSSNIKGKVSDVHCRLGVDWQPSKWSAPRSTHPDTATLLATQTPASLQQISSRCEEGSESNLATELIVEPVKNKSTCAFCWCM